MVLVDGEPALYVERNRKGVITLPAFEQHAALAIGALVQLAEDSPRRELSLERLDGEAILSSPWRGPFEQAGFVREYLGLVRRVPTLAHPRARSA